MKYISVSFKLHFTTLGPNYINRPRNRNPNSLLPLRQSSTTSPNCTFFQILEHSDYAVKQGKSILPFLLIRISSYPHYFWLCLEKLDPKTPKKDAECDIRVVRLRGGGIIDCLSSGITLWSVSRSSLKKAAAS